MCVAPPILLLLELAFPSRLREFAFEVLWVYVYIYIYICIYILIMIASQAATQPVVKGWSNDDFDSLHFSLSCERALMGLSLTADRALYPYQLVGNIYFEL